MDSHQTVIEECIGKLQGLLGEGTPKTSTGSQPKAVSIAQFDTNFAKCLQRAQSICPQLVQLTSIYGQAADVMKAILGYSKVCPKPAPEQEQQLKQKIMVIAKKIDVLQKKNPDFSQHCKSFRQIMQTTFWVFVPSPEFLLKGSIESADFWALKFQRKKNLDHNDWYKLFQVSVRGLQDFVMAEYAMGLTFNFHGQNQWSQLLDGSIPTPEPVKIQKVEKQSVKVQESQKVLVKKSPKTQVVGQVCTVMNYDNQTVELTAAQIKMMHGIFFENSSKTHLKVTTKFKSIVINNCSDVILEMKSCISGIEVVNSKNVKIYVHEGTPSISADSSQSVSIVLSENNLQCDIVSSKTSELTVAYRKEDGSESKAELVSSQLVTKWDANSKQFKTTVYDKFL